ncbi:class I SAM-dependent methyltransferase [Streptomyces sp. NPDC048253]|uniref:class I SAM-dependent methyltransferase n=1 Tax=Streptomyces sp. NPDC048253 TaxID=3365524 RepID=UPI0037139B3F
MLDGLAHWERTRAPLTGAAILKGLGVTGSQVMSGVALDVGCGSAAVARELSDRFDRVIGLDIDHAILRRARVPEVPLITADAAKLPLATESIDYVFSYGALHHTDAKQSLAEIVRVTSPGGRIALIDFSAPNMPRQPRTGYTWRVVTSFRSYSGRLGLVAALRIVLFRLSPRWRRHLRADVFLSERDFVSVYGSFLPGARFSHEEGRMTVTWSKPHAL